MNTPDYPTGVIHGRFQILHNDHVKYLMAGKSCCRHLVVGITNPDPCLTKEEHTDPQRHISAANPLSYYERYTLIKAVLEEEGLIPQNYSIVPFPINFPELYCYYIPRDAVFFLTIYDEWGKQKLRYFKDLGLKTHVLWKVPIEEKGISGSNIRRFMAEGEPWEHLVPRPVSVLMKKWRIPERLRRTIHSDHH